ncbi:DUF523 domain-containing protein [Thalassotalea sp. Y01]|uniref:DUF523 domain-containing protein n=1 Tax=Thalassotalea sp. Y01 TaxID=2729613 RepID=UPI00145E8173|nr:DUF523 domain-containing protein [Thalassotalea sp. Y01]NMP16279.1 DUF523 domain-containing protein [Thalassotalea sp. Y01]
MRKRVSDKILISSCLLGNPVRYDGQSKGLRHPQINLWQQQQRLVVICPEQAGGLPTPRPRAEQKDGHVVNEFGDDVTPAFERGALVALALCEQHNIGYALLKEFSPSCGSQQIYDGSFSGQRINGMGETAKLLNANGIRVYSELTLEQMITDIEQRLNEKNND